MYLVIIVLGIFGEVFVRQRLIVANDAMATAANIRAHELLWRWSVGLAALARTAIRQQGHAYGAFCSRAASSSSPAP